jgi:hypothetical protein
MKERSFNGRRRKAMTCLLFTVGRSYSAAVFASCGAACGDKTAAKKLRRQRASAGHCHRFSREASHLSFFMARSSTLELVGERHSELQIPPNKSSPPSPGFLELQIEESAVRRVRKKIWVVDDFRDYYCILVVSSPLYSRT